MDARQDKAEQVSARVARLGNDPRAHTRLWAAVILVAGVAVLAVSTWLKPDPRGFGTHQQFGTGPCGMLIQTGLPCPTCGMTTAFAHTVRGQWGRAFWAQPAGFVLALATIVSVGGAGWVLAKGRWPVVNLLWVTPFRLFLGLLVLLLGGWGFKLVVGLLDGSLPVGPVRLQ